MPPRLILLALLLATLATLWLLPAPAFAGTYDVYACRLPDGSPAPMTGWTREDRVDPALEVVATMTDDCAGGIEGIALRRRRFRTIAGPTRLRFEARVPKQTGHPYVEGASPPVVVKRRQ